MALYNIRGNSWNSQTARRNRRKAARRRKARYKRLPTAVKALRIARANKREVDKLRPKLKYYPWVRPVCTDFPVGSDAYEHWMPMCSRLRTTTGLANKVLGRHTNSLSVNAIDSTGWRAAFNVEGTGLHPDGICIWDWILDNGVSDELSTTGDALVDSIDPIVVAVSAPLNHVPFDPLGKDCLRTRASNSIYSHLIQIPFGLRVRDAASPDINGPSVDRGLQPTNITMMLIRVPITVGDTDRNTAFRDDQSLDSNPYQTNVSNTNVRGMIQEMFEFNILSGPKRPNHNLLDLKLRPGIHNVRSVNNPPAFSPYTPGLTNNRYTGSHSYRVRKFDVLAKKTYRLGTHGTSDILANYEVHDQFTLKLGRETFDHDCGGTPGDQTKAIYAYAMAGYEYRLVMIHNGATTYSTATSAATASTEATYPTCYDNKSDLHNRVYCHAKVKHWFTELT